MLHYRKKRGVKCCGKHAKIEVLVTNFNDKNIMEVSAKTIERLSLYRRALINLKQQDKKYIFSHELGNILNLTAVQIRRDLMLIGCSSKLKKGYEVEELIALIDKILDTDAGMNVAVIGMGNLGRALTTYFNNKREKLKIVAAFDADPNKINQLQAGIPCYALTELKTIIDKEKIDIAMLTLPHAYVEDVADKLMQAGIKGLVNYTSKPIKPIPGVYVEDIDMLTALEKVAFYVKSSIQAQRYFLYEDEEPTF